jgi:hypothetical protein
VAVEILDAHLLEPAGLRCRPRRCGRSCLPAS